MKRIFILKPVKSFFGWFNLLILVWDQSGKNEQFLKIFRRWVSKFLKTVKFINYSKSLRFGFLDGSLERSPKMNKETMKIIVV